jgi:hypothetical protein
VAEAGLLVNHHWVILGPPPPLLPRPPQRGLGVVLGHQPRRHELAEGAFQQLSLRAVGVGCRSATFSAKRPARSPRTARMSTRRAVSRFIDVTGSGEPGF